MEIPDLEKKSNNTVTAEKIKRKGYRPKGIRARLSKKETLKNLRNEELSLINQINDLDFKNSLLSDNLDLDYIETLIRERFLFGKKNETIYIIKKDEK